MAFAKSKQDEWVLRYFNHKKNGFYIDLGAHDGRQFSNTMALEKDYNWKGICIEANDESFKKLIKNRKNSHNKFVNCCIWNKDGEKINFVCQGMASGVKDESARWNKYRLPKRKSESTIVTKTTKSLLSILKEQNCPKDIDFLSMDIEGAEEKVINDELFQNYNIKCVIVEIYCECFPNEEFLKHYPKTVVHDVLKNNGYELAHTFGVGEFAYVLKG